MPNQHIMKKSFLYLTLIGLILTGFSCTKEFTPLVENEPDFTSRAHVKFVNFVMGSLRNYVFADNKYVSGTASAYTNVYPSNSGSYMSLPTSVKTLTVRDTLATTRQNVVSIPTTLEANAYYTLFTYDSLTNAKAKMIRDWIEIPSDTTARIRFAHFGYSTVAIPNVDVYSSRLKANVFSNVTATNITDFIPYASRVSDTLYIRATGTTTNLVTLNNFSAAAKRSYTIALRGSMRLSSGTLARAATTVLH